MKLPMGVIGYGVSGFMPGSSEELVLNGRDVTHTVSFYRKVPEIAVPKEADLFFSSDYSVSSQRRKE